MREFSMAVGVVASQQRLPNSSLSEPSSINGSPGRPSGTSGVGEECNVGPLSGQPTLQRLCFFFFYCLPLLRGPKKTVPRRDVAEGLK
ncbi:hypothetical protein NDU88_002475 [Pleurodeles waltl]|uniref:Uncharacterized protein n=1 Tax=Pleurodeles waltl TaxID=8319 RepID=A0AAV7MB42_PLEWA|nr:hypothetical protein NDU88_002475 [Pleurodeles waltl]